MDTKAYRGEIDGMRAIAVALVVAFHAGIERVFLRSGLRYAEGGYVGVDVFYVISGFLITGLLVEEMKATGRIDLSRFYARRIRRLLPVATLVLVTTLVASLVLLPPMDWLELARDALAAAGYVANIKFASSATQYLAGDSNHSPFLHYWSLSVEEQFYFIWPGILSLVAIRCRAGAGADASAKFVRWLTVTTASLVVVSAAASLAFTSSSPPWAYFGLHTRAWELGVGALAALLPTLRGTWWSPLRVTSGWIGLVAILASALLFTRDTGFPGYAAWLPVAGAALVLLAADSEAKWNVGRLLSLAPLRYVGRVSYAWYLWHWPMIVLAGPVVGALDRPTTPVVTSAAALSFVAAVATHHWLENPTRRNEALVRGWRPLLIATGIVVTMVLAVGAVGLVATEGSAATDPAFARRDRPRLADTCAQDFAGTKATECVFGSAAGRERIALIGDSHAKAWLPAFDLVAKQRGWQGHLYSKGACPLVDVARFLPNYRRRYTECDEWKLNVMRALRDLRPSMIVVARYGGYVDTLLDRDGSRASAAQGPAIWRDGAARMFDALAKVTPRVVVMRDVPKAATDVPACLSKGDPSRCDFRLAQGLAQDAPLFEAELAAARGRQHVSVIDLTSAICETDVCRVRTPDRTIKYRDDNHLTATFSAMLTPALQTRLTSASSPSIP